MIKYALAALSLFVAAPAMARDPGELLRLEDLARAPAMQSVVISPDGTRIAWIEIEDGRGTIYMRRTGAEARVRIYRNAERSLSNVVWSADGRWLLTLQDAGGDEGYHLFRIDPSTPSAPPVDLTPMPGVEAEFIRLPSEAPETAVIWLNARNRGLSDAVAVDLATGTLTEVARNDIGFTEFHADANGNVVLGAVTRADGNLDVMVRVGPSEPWRVLYTAPVDERFKIVALAPDGRSAVVRSNRNHPADRLLRMDLTTGGSVLLTDEGCGRFDEDGAVLDSAGQPAFASCVTERATVAGLLPQTRQQIAQVRRLVGEDAALQLQSATSDLRSAVYFTDRTNRSGRYILYHEGRATVLGEHRPWLAETRFVSSNHYWVPARDGLELSVYVTRPVGQIGPGPAVVSLHGGPWTRDDGSFAPEVQLLASRGYTVVQVNFRGSTGFGKRHFEAGVRQFGRAMSNDVIDALDWAIARGAVDADRVCLMGGSYGGYATLVGLTRDSGRFRCGIDFAGPVDLVTLVEAFPPSWGPFLPRSWHRFVGDPSVASDRADMHDRSPIGRLDALSAPLMIFQGANDPRVTQAQSDQVVCALRRKAVAVEYLLAGNEGHSFGNEETGLAVNRAMELFLADQLGGHAQQAVDPKIELALDSLRAAGDAVVCPDAAPPVVDHVRDAQSAMTSTLSSPISPGA